MEKGRYAPSPSGRMHLGNLMCSLLAWLSARAQGGRVVLRIEDLDAARCPRRYADLLEQDKIHVKLIDRDRERCVQLASLLGTNCVCLTN